MKTEAIKQTDTTCARDSFIDSTVLLITSSNAIYSKKIWPQK